MRQDRRIFIIILCFVAIGVSRLEAQTEIGFVEDFALAEDRREAISELIPGTDDFFFYSCLHHQNEQQLAESEAVLQKWQGAFPRSSRLKSMRLRQSLLNYGAAPEVAAESVRRELGLRLNHQPPSQDVTAEYPSVLPAEKINSKKLIRDAISQDRGLQSLTQWGLWQVLDAKLTPEQIRALVGQLTRSDLNGVVDLIAQELATRDTKGFGWARVHGLLTIEQLDRLAARMPAVWEQSRFVEEYLARQLPSDGDLSDPAVLRSYLVRAEATTRSLPESQISLRALILGNLLKLNISEGHYDRELFETYLAIPRSAAYYIKQRGRSRNLADFNYSINGSVPLAPLGDDTELVRRHLMHFLENADDVGGFAPWIDRGYLDRLFAETKILAGVGDASIWFAKLSPREQQEIKSRVELRFAPNNDALYAVDDAVKLKVELKNVPELTVRVYELSLKNFYRRSSKRLSTDIDLDGMIPAIEQQLEYEYAAERRHVEEIALPQLTGRGAWVVDLLGAGTRSRAVIQKGRLIATYRISDAGQIVQVRDDDGSILRDAEVELQGTTYTADADGDILLPFANRPVTRELLLIDGEFAARQTMLHEAERYSLAASFLLNLQSLVGGNVATALLAARLSVGDRAVSLELLEDAKLEIFATDLDGTTSTKTVTDLALSDAIDLEHSFSVPMRLANVTLKLSGRVKRVSDGEYQTVEASHSLECNGLLKTNWVGAVYVTELDGEYQLQLRGRNGEPLPARRLSISLYSQFVKRPVTIDMATNVAGQIKLGRLEGIREVRISADKIPEQVIVVDRPNRSGPRYLNVPAGEAFTIGKASDLTGVDSGMLSLWRVVGKQKPTDDLSEKLSVEGGAIECQSLEPGNYLYQNHYTNRTMRIGVVKSMGDAAVGNGDFVTHRERIVEIERLEQPTIKNVETQAGGIQVDIANAGPGTRVHIVASPFRPTENGTGPKWPIRSPYSLNFPAPRSQFLNSLKLDEEYDYILKRRGQERFPGNMLPSPSLLIHPWDIATSENSRLDARAGDKLAEQSDRPMSAAQPLAAEAEPESRRSSVSNSFEFLASPAAALLNLPVVEGKVSVNAEALEGCSFVEVHVVDPAGTDSAEVTLPLAEIETRDMRLAQGLDSAKTLLQVREVQILAPGESLRFDRSASPRLQTYTTLNGLFQFYGSILKDPNWEKLRFVTRWNKLPPDEKLVLYSKHACHELNVFIYFKDTAFFEEVVRPFVQQKMSKQFVDHFLLEMDLSPYLELPRLRELNAAELVLLASRMPDRKRMIEDLMERQVEALPTDLRLRRMYFDAGLMGTALEQVALSDGVFADLDETESSDLNFAVPEAPAPGRGGGGFGGRGRRTMSRASAEDQFFGVERLSRKSSPKLFQSLATTRRWVESNYFRTRIAEQDSDFIGASAFWKEALDSGGKPLLPTNVELPVRKLSEALLALALADLPEESQPVEFTSTDDGISLTAKAPAVVMLEAIRETESADESKAIQLFIGQEIFASDGNDKPVDVAQCVIGRPYTAKIVVSNPTNEKRTFDLLYQCPAGSIPLSGGRSTQSVSNEIAAFSTYQTQYEFYFPAPGEFQHFGAQVSADGVALAAAPTQNIVVHEKRMQANAKSWEYIADWATTKEVVDYLATANVDQLNLERLAFRMSDKDAFAAITTVLAERGHYEPVLWAYAVKHLDQARMRQLLRMAPALHSRVGPAIDSPVLVTSQVERKEFEHVEFRPLVLARIHMLGPKRVILNSDLAAQYSQLLHLIAYQPGPSPSDRLQVVYYLLLQNRIAEAVEMFAAVKREDVTAQMQFDYLTAYLAFSTGDYEQAKEVAAKYEEYPVDRWQSSFQAVLSQLATRDALIAGAKSAQGASEADDAIMRRDATNESGAERAGTLALNVDSQNVELQYSNLDSLKVNFYVMDVELLFSRRPFVGLKGQQLPAIAPNASVTIDTSVDGPQRLAPPKQLANKNLIVEATGGGLSQTALMTPSGLGCEVAESFGQVRVRASATSAPVEAAYVKVYAKLRNGTTRFYKDGYTDLRGYFDYVTLSTNDLDSVERFAILVLDENLGAEIREASPPAK